MYVGILFAEISSCIPRLKMYCKSVEFNITGITVIAKNNKKCYFDSNTVLIVQVEVVEQHHLEVMDK